VGSAAAGNAGRTTFRRRSQVPDDQTWFDVFRFGVWPDFFPGVQFSHDPEALNQFFRSVTPNTGPFDAELIANAVSALFGKIGPAILVSHSQGGGPGWLTAIKSPNVRGVIAFEPGSGFVFPEGDGPTAMPSLTGTLEGIRFLSSSSNDSRRCRSCCTSGDNIPGAPSPTPVRTTGESVLQWPASGATRCESTRRDATLVHLPDLESTATRISCSRT